MTRPPSAHPLTRSLLVWAGVTAAVTVLAQVLLPLPLSLGGTFEDLLVRACSWVLLVCAAWCWCVTTVVVGAVLRHCRHGRPAAGLPTPGVPATVRRVVLAACGVALSTAAATPALATPGPGPVAEGGGPPGDHSGRVVLGGLPFPSRATDSQASPTGGHGTVTVRAGDSLWTLAERALPRASPATAPLDPAAVASASQRLYAINRDVVGPDPDLVHPGQVLRLPDLTQPPAPEEP